MNSKNILITIGVFGIGIILYKLLLGLVLPIALFVSLGYVLRFLLKGPGNDSVEELSQILTKSEPPSSIDNIVEIKPIVEEEPAEENTQIPEEKPAEGKQPIAEEKTQIAEENTQIAEVKPAEASKRIDEYKTIAEDKSL